MTNIIERIEKGNLVYEIIPDGDSCYTLTEEGAEFNIKNIGPYGYDICDEKFGEIVEEAEVWDVADIVALQLQLKEAKYVARPLFIEEHGSLHVYSTQNIQYMNVRQYAGFIGWNREQQEALGLESRSEIDRYLKEILDIINSDINGNVYKVLVYENGEIIDSCGGYLDIETIKEDYNL